MFIVVYLLSLRFIHPYPVQLTIKQAGQLTRTANRPGFHDPEMFYLLAVMLINALITLALCAILLRIWQRWRKRKAKK